MKKSFKISSLILVFALALSMSGCGDKSLPRQYEVSFETNQAGIMLSPMTVLEGYHISNSEVDLNNLEEYMPAGYIFRGWYSDKTLTEAWDIDTYRVTKDMTLYAKWSYADATPSEVALTDDAISNTISWIQSGVNENTDVEVKLWQGVITVRKVKDPNTGEMVDYEYTDYSSTAEYVAEGSFSFDGYFATYAISSQQKGGIYKVTITTKNEGEDAHSVETELKFKGTGTEEDPYLIYNESDLKYLTTNSFKEGTYAELRNDVTLQSVYADKLNCVYDGVFNGNAHTITLRNNSGLFFTLGEHAEVYGVKFSGSISGSDPSIGVVCNYNSGYIHNVESVSVSVTSDGGKVNDLSSAKNGGCGGICGTNNNTGRITLCTITSGQANVITGKIAVGGIAGINYGYIYNFNSTVTPCSAIIGAYNGKELSSTISNSFAGVAVGINYGTVSQVNIDGKINCRRVDYTNSTDTGSTNVGGVVGYNAKGGLIDECLFQGMRIVGDKNVGGICGYNDGTISNCFTGRRIRKPSSTPLSERWFISPVIGSYNVGGICGACGENSVITNCFSTANVYSYMMEGYALAPKADNCIYVNENVQPRLSSNYLGQTNGEVYSNTLVAPVGNGNELYDVAERVGSTINNLLGADYVYDSETMVYTNKPNTQKIIHYLTLLGDKFGYNSTYGISLCWQSANTKTIESYTGGNE